MNQSCPICAEIVWETEWDIDGDEIIHEMCRDKYNRHWKEMRAMKCRMEKLERELNALKKVLAE